ncbi:MAG: nucleotide exchange factor GrpE, partial [bacterium]|nr:nucleotide exchange factor GrpE [bacterium]
MNYKDKEIPSTNPFKNGDEEEMNTEVNPEAEVIVDEEKQQPQEEVSEEITNEEEESAEAKLQKDYENLNNQYVRLAADFDNFRKRQAQERESLISYGAEDAMKKLIEVLDNFDRAKG